MDIGTLVTRAGHRFGDRIAIEGVDAADRRTFAQLADRVVRIASGLLASGLRPGDRVLDLQSHSTAYLETDLAIRAAGLVRVALNYRLHPTDWQRIASDSAARGLIYHERFAADVAPVREQIEHVLVVGDGPETSLEQLIAGASPAPLHPRDPDDLCGLHYSS